MVLLGLKRVERIYPFWALIYLILLGAMIYFQIIIPKIILILVIIFLAKTILLDYGLISIKRKRVYWAEHGPFHFLVFLIGIFDLFGFQFFSGFVNLPTTILALIGFILDFVKDLKENPKVHTK